MKLKILAAALAATALIPATARAQGSETASSGVVSATLSWDGGELLRNAKLTIARSGAVTFDQAIPDVACDGCSLTGGGSDDLRVVGLDTVDERFNDRFTSHAGSFSPAAVYRYERPGGVAGLFDVTQDFPSVIRHNAAEAKKRFARLKPGELEAEGFVAAYVADQYLLGRGSTGLKELDKQVKRGILGQAKTAKAYRARLLRLLRRYGYR